MPEAKSAPGKQLSCVSNLLQCLGNAAKRFEAGKPLGPYLVNALLEDVHLCPALQQNPSKNAQDALHDAIERARRSVEVCIACPSSDRDWATEELRTAVTHAQDCFNAWRSSDMSGQDISEGEIWLDELSRIGVHRCPLCTFAQDVPQEEHVQSD